MALCSPVFNNKTAKRRNSFQGPAISKRICGSLLPSSIACYSSSDDQNDDSSDEQSCYNADQVKAKRRASTRVSFCMDSELCRAVSKYSDDEEDNDANDSTSTSGCTLINNPRKMSTSSDSDKKVVSDDDKTSRSRCFEYLVGAIDEAWARYCDVTTSVEDEVYGYNTPSSIATDDEDYLGNTTDITDYESDFEISKSRQSSISTGDKTNSSSLQALKDRLTKAKYFLQDLVDSDDLTDVVSFWKRWDMIKYATIELVEDDDDDEIIESTIDELEDGRCFVN
ncbi:DEHA2E15730p [Debaryomyces hansenii CBS767]|uniref:DEHA2E15730p n=1 Tax=Debaryomyces hansenii (strain ATCC 36239 / CBS 767 / BCRC 21394 / JCM 1990 / NBRC 0083 / IGC 2968) TaxID=284592 RepID=Q6BP83_DEBHA|nr:DEHA2E15730p [Debaryomyces hansenii CBS767]CAG88240.2 DEHA2E15730p [Debaryomyces hansenii CBS767]|eukprot:XP_459987.2 DEHA2E15730p [Debaryomyces hansenii CBS767]